MTTPSFFELFNQASLLFAAVVICISCLYYTLIRTRPNRLQAKMFLAIFADLLLSAMVDMGNIFIKPFAAASHSVAVFQEINQYIYFVTHSLAAPLFCFYITVVTLAFYRLNKKYRFVYEFPLYVIELLVLTNPLTHWVYYFDESHTMVRNWGENILYIISALYFAATIIIGVLSWKVIDRKKRRALTYFFIVITLGVLTQLLFSQIHIELFAEAIAMTGIMITIENEDDRKNSRTGLYNQIALASDIRTNILSRHPFTVICIKMLNPQNLMQLIGPMNIESLTVMTAEYLSSLVSKQSIYYLNPGTFVILNQDPDGYRNKEIGRAIYERYQHEWHFQGRDTIFHAAVFCVEVPNDFKSPEQLMALIMSPMLPNANKKDDIYFGNDLNFFLRRTQVERAILHGLDNHNFEVYYQPIYDAKDMSIHSGEALLRLHDAEFGEIYPDEFLPVAERSGHIFTIGDFVLEEVCKFLNSGIPVEMGISMLNINLSVIQCTQPSYAERILQIVHRYNIEPGRINFEITETAATTDFEGLEAFVRTLKEHGFHFSVDDYGIGYSNVHSIFSLDVDMIKVDRSILWEAEASEIGRIIMQSSADMIKRMGKKILISGVESPSQIELANEFDVDYLQGYYFSNPVSQNEFISILKATRLARVEEQRAIAANEAMSNFLANMSHEIRTPINAVLGMDEMILRVSKDDKILEYARTIEAAGRTLLSLINDILDFSKIEAGNMDIIPTNYDLSSVLNDVVNMIDIKAKQKELRLLVDVDATTPEHLYGDEIRLRQIMLNILNNAIKYTNEGSVSLQISHKLLTKDSVSLVLMIRDTGIGIKEEDLARLFDKFQRLDQNKNKTIEGSGLGLAIVHQLLELMDGKIDVKSTYGSGSTFTVTLPQRVTAPESIGDFRRRFAMTNEAVPKYQESFQAPDAKILVVDDTPMNLVVVRELLKKTKVQVSEARSGMECLKLVQDNAYDLIFLDYRMPEMDGIETLKRFHELPNNLNEQVPIVALTANAISGARERFIMEGFDDYMTKPINADKLEQLLLKYLPEEKIIHS